MLLLADINLSPDLRYVIRYVMDCRKTSVTLIPDQVWDSVRTASCPIVLEISSGHSEVGC